MIIHWNQKKVSSLLSSMFIVLFALIIPKNYAENIIKDAANTGFHLLEDPINPRFIAMGSAGSASKGTGFSFYNPALPFLVGKSFLTVEYGKYPEADLNRAHFEGIAFIKEWFFGISFHTESIEDIFPVDMWGKLPLDQPFSQQFTNVSFNLGFSKWEDISFAISLNAMQDRIEHEYAYAYTFSVGAVAIPIPNHLTFGLSLLNYGFSTPMLGADTKETIGNGEDIPMNSRLGITWKHSIRDIPYSVALDVVYRNVRDRDKSFKRNIQNRFTVPLGFEIKPLPPLAIRMGKRFNMSTEVLSFGIGLNLDLLTVDLSFVIPRLVDDNQIKWLTAISYFLRNKKEVKKTLIKEKPKTMSPINNIEIIMEPQTIENDIQENFENNSIILIDDNEFTEKETISIPVESNPVDVEPNNDIIVIDSIENSNKNESLDTTSSVDEVEKNKKTLESETISIISDSDEIILESEDYFEPVDTVIIDISETEENSNNNEIKNSDSKENIIQKDNSDDD